MRKIALIAGAAFCLTAAIAPPVWAGDGSLIGAGVGGAVGGLLGSSLGRGPGTIVTTGIGIGAGALVGSSVGQSIEESNRTSYASGGYDYDQPVEPIFTGSYAPNYVAPPAVPTYIDDDTGAYCRPFSQEIIVDGRQSESYGTACLQPDGTWRTVQ